MWLAFKLAYLKVAFKLDFCLQPTNITGTQIVFLYQPYSSFQVPALRYTNADLKISLYGRVRIKTIPWKFWGDFPRILDLFIFEICIFHKN